MHSGLYARVGRTVRFVCSHARLFVVVLILRGWLCACLFVCSFVRSFVCVVCVC